MSFQGKQRGAHVWAFVEHYGEPPTDRPHVRHVVCDNPPCVNWRHLAPGTTQENMDDKVRRGRQARQSRPVKLDWRTVRAIRDIYGKGNISMAKLSKVYGVSPSMIHLIVNNRQWIERVDESGEVGVVIEDGEVKA